MHNNKWILPSEEMWEKGQKNPHIARPLFSIKTIKFLYYALKQR